MGKSNILKFPLQETKASKMLDNIARVTCMPDTLAESIMVNAMYVSYKFQKLHMTASQVERLELPDCADHEERYQKELGEES